MKIFRDTTLKTKFFLSIILTAAVIVLILLSSVLTVFYRQFLDLQTESSVNQLHYIRDQLDYYLLSMNNYTRMIVADDNVQDYALKYRDEKESFTAADKKNMQSDIRRFLQSIPYIHSASIYATDRSFVVSTAIINHPAALEPVPFCESPEFFIRDKYSNYTLSTNVQTLSKILPFYDIASGSLLGYFEISITEEDISNIYRSNSTGTSHFFIVDNDGYVVSTDGSYELNSRYKPFTTLGRDIPTHFKTGENSICFVTCLEPLDWYIINEVDLAAFFRPVYVILLIAAAISVFCLGASMVISRKVSDTITKPLYHLIAHIRKVKQGLWVPVNENPSDTDIGLLFREFDSMIVAQEQLKDELLDSQRIQNKISVELLQQQVNPHFLYNTLDNICSLAELNEKEKLIGCGTGSGQHAYCNFI